MSGFLQSWRLDGAGAETGWRNVKEGREEVYPTVVDVLYPIGLLFAIVLSLALAAELLTTAR
jgi:hypothetical protein